MKKYFNENKEKFNLEKGTIKEIKNYHPVTTTYLTQDQDSGKWYMTFMNRYRDEQGRDCYTVKVPWYAKICIEDMAALCGYYYDEDGNIITDLFYIYN